MKIIINFDTEKETIEVETIKKQQEVQLDDSFVNLGFLGWNYYWINRNGEVLHESQKTGKLRRVNPTLSGGSPKRRYYYVSLSEGGRKTAKPLHWLLGRCFVDGYAEGLEIDHIDGTTTNEISNLRWVTHKVNMQNRKPKND